MKEMLIGEVAKKAGLKASAIRYYESAGLLPSPRRINGQRRYDSSVMEYLAIIQIAQQAGFTIAEIKTLFHGFSPQTPPKARWKVLASRKLSELEDLITRATNMKRILKASLECGCLRLDECAIIMRQSIKGKEANIKRIRLD
jgi:MerR family transcriptional regulator, redox-sensitive transcriptional activator SoxR